jgi:hypothetical protein
VVEVVGMSDPIPIIVYDRDADDAPHDAALYADGIVIVDDGTCYALPGGRDEYARLRRLIGERPTTPETTGRAH